MNVLKPDIQTSVVTLLKSGISQHEIQRKLRIDRKTVRRYGRLSGLLGAGEEAKSPMATGGGPENPPPRPPGQAGDCADKLENPPWPPRPEARSECAPYQEWIAEQVERGRNAMAIYQDLVDLYGFRYRYNSVKRYVGKLRKERGGPLLRN